MGIQTVIKSIKSLTEEDLETIRKANLRFISTEKSNLTTIAGIKLQVNSIKEEYGMIYYLKVKSGEITLGNAAVTKRDALEALENV